MNVFGGVYKESLVGCTPPNPPEITVITFKYIVASRCYIDYLLVATTNNSTYSDNIVIQSLLYIFTCVSSLHAACITL